MERLCLCVVRCPHKLLPTPTCLGLKGFVVVVVVVRCPQCIVFTEKSVRSILFHMLVYPKGDIGCFDVAARAESCSL